MDYRYSLNIPLYRFLLEIPDSLWHPNETNTFNYTMHTL